MGALDLSKGQPLYTAIQAHQRRMEETRTAGEKRKTYHLEKLVPCWKVMRGYDKWSGAVGALSNGLAAEDSSDRDSDEDDDCGDSGDSDSGSATAVDGQNGGCGSAAGAGACSAAGEVGGAVDFGAAGGALGTERAAGGAAAASVSSKSPRAGSPLELRPIGSEEAKRQKAGDLSNSRELRARTTALGAIANASKERSWILLFILPEMRFIEDANFFCLGKAPRRHCPRPASLRTTGPLLLRPFWVALQLRYRRLLSCTTMTESSPLPLLPKRRRSGSHKHVRGPLMIKIIYLMDLFWRRLRQADLLDPSRRRRYPIHVMALLRGCRCSLPQRCVCANLTLQLPRALHRARGLAPRCLLFLLPAKLLRPRSGIMGPSHSGARPQPPKSA